MRVPVRKLLLAACASIAATQASADYNGVYLPSPPTGSGGEDSIETSSGTRCRQSMNSNGSYVDLGVVGNAASPSSHTFGGAFSDQRDREAMAYARVTIPLGKRPERIDCSRVYELEIEKLRREVELLKLNAN